MTRVKVLLDALGESLFQLASVSSTLDAPALKVVVNDPCLRRRPSCGDILMGVGLTTAEQTSEVVHELAAAGGGIVVVKSSPEDVCSDGSVSEGVAVLTVPQWVDWGDVMQLLGAALAQSESTTTQTHTNEVIPGDLFEFANSLADILDSPIT